MNADQKNFFDFFMARVQADKSEEAREMLLGNFKRQEDGQFTAEYMQQIAPKMLALLKPEFVEEFKNAAAHMSSTLR
ncbi:MAG: hypothetical protein FWC59_02325 [Actinomycetia bacterium]|nr:hypothetical protein [Actinomycetes bacterium]